MDTDQWRRVPHERVEKTWKDRILQLGHRIPTLLERMDVAMQLPATSSQKFIAVWRDMAILRRGLRAWFAAVETEASLMDDQGVSIPLFWKRPATRYLTNDILSVPEAVEYRSQEIAEALTYYVSILQLS
jgi:hypothetical protein